MLKFFRKDLFIMYIYQRVRDLREDNDKTQAQIANLLNTGITTYRRWETGEREIPLHIIIQLAIYYNVSLDYITGLSKDPTQKWTSKNNINITTNYGNINMN